MFFHVCCLLLFIMMLLIIMMLMLLLFIMSLMMLTIWHLEVVHDCNFDTEDVERLTVSEFAGREIVECFKFIFVILMFNDDGISQFMFTNEWPRSWLLTFNNGWNWAGANWPSFSHYISSLKGSPMTICCRQITNIFEKQLHGRGIVYLGEHLWVSFLGPESYLSSL